MIILYLAKVKLFMINECFSWLILLQYLILNQLNINPTRHWSAKLIKSF